METKSNKIENSLRIFFALIFAVGVAGHTVNSTQNLMLMLTPLVLFICFLVLFYFALNEKSKNFLIWMGVTFIFTLVCEIIGVNTGLIFGNYEYGNTLGIKFFGVPPIIGINWLFVIIGSHQISKRFFKNEFIQIVFAVIIALTFDFILEPVAIKLNYWNWSDGIIPLSNYFSWLVISTISLIMFNKFKVRLKSRIFEYFLSVQIVFFLLLNLVV